jgi:hypothetical protein
LIVTFIPLTFRHHHPGGTVHGSLVAVAPLLAQANRGLLLFHIVLARAIERLGKFGRDSILARVALTATIFFLS